MGFPPHLPCHSPGLHPGEQCPRLHSSQRGGVWGLRRSCHCPCPDGKGFQVYFPPRTEQGHTVAAETVATDFQMIHFQGVNQQRDSKGHMGEDLGLICIEQALLFMVPLSFEHPMSHWHPQSPSRGEPQVTCRHSRVSPMTVARRRRPRLLFPPLMIF